MELFKKVKRIRGYSPALVKKIIKTLANVPIKQVRVALNGIKAFYSQISSVKPDLSNPDILLCYNQTAKLRLSEKNYNENQIDVEILDPLQVFMEKI